MLIDTKVAIAIRCSTCNHLHIYETTLFQLFNHKKAEIICPCGQHNATIKTKGCKSLLMEIDCHVCQYKHTFKYTLKQLLTENIVTRCMKSGIEICFLVSHGNINGLIGKNKMSFDSIDSIYNQIDFPDFFNSPDIMLKSIERIKDLDSNGLLGCSCGSNIIEMNMFRDRIELKCAKCGGIKVIYAETNDDFNNLVSKDSITIRERGFECIDAISQNKDTSKK